METIEIDYCPRPYFVPYHNRTQRFACIVAHRRAGKTVACIQDLQKDAIDADVPAIHAYIAPTYSQAKTVAFDYLTEAASPLFPYGAKVNRSDLKVTYPNGAQVRLFGADNYDALRGLRLRSAVLDEPADMDPRAWPAVIRPALSDLRGGATFIGTARGHNHFYEILQKAQADPDWLVMVLKASELVPQNDQDPQAKQKHLLTSDELLAARRDMTEELYNQEYECDFEAAIMGAYYGKQMSQAQKDGRITKVPFDPTFQVWTAWDIGGNRDATAIWFVQLVGREIRVIDYYEAIGADSAPHARAVLEKPYQYAQHFLPHDAGPDRIGIDKSYKDFLEGHGLRNVLVLPAQMREHGINAVRLLLPRCTFASDKCHTGIEALKLYRAEYDAKNKTLKANPLHDWTSHGADAFRYLAVALDRHVTKPAFHRKIVYPNLGVA